MPLFPVTIGSPGIWGVNLQESNQLLHPNWATKADGMQLDDSGQIGARGSITITTTVPAALELLRLHNWINAAGTEVIISATVSTMWQNVTDLTSAGNNITPTGAPTNGFWKFLNFNGKVLAWQAGHTPLSYNGSGDFATITVSDGGTLPDGDAAHAAFGRVWAVDDDKQTVRYSGLLDETKWATASGAGSIDMRNVWTQGLDYVTAISSIGANLVIFGRKHIVIYTDGSGSSVGLDPAQMYVVDVVEGTGCVARDTVTAVGEGDLTFLSEVGVQSLRRVIQSKDNPLVTISWQIADHLSSAVKAELASQASPATDARGFTSCYVASTDQLFLIHNRGTIEDVYLFHPNMRMQDDLGRELVPIMYWDTSVLANMRSMIQTRGGTIYVTGGLDNHINTYDPNGTLDNSLSPIYSLYESGWMKWGDPQLAELNKTMKFAQLTIVNSGELTSSTAFRYGADFETTLEELDGPSVSTLITRNIYDTTGNGSEGQNFKVGVEDARFGGKSIQQIVMHFKPGRIAFVHDVEGQGAVSVSTPSANLQLLVAVSNSNTSTSCVQTSMDGTTWTARTAIQAAWRSVCYSSDLNLLAAVATNSIMTSPDGITWTSRTSPGAGGWISVCWSSELAKFIAVGSLLSTQRVMTSTDGITWTLVTTPANCNLNWSAVIWSQRLHYFIASEQAASNGDIMTSVDGVTWVLRTSAAIGDSTYIAESGSYIIASGPSDLDVAYSVNGVAWSDTSNFAGSGITAMAYSPALDLFAVAGGVALTGIYTAPGDDPTTWTARTTTGFQFTCGVWSTVLEKFFFLNTVASNAEGASSSDGITWSAITLASTQNWVSVCETEEV